MPSFVPGKKGKVTAERRVHSRIRKAVRVIGIALAIPIGIALITSVVGVWKAEIIALPAAPPGLPVVQEVTHLHPVAVSRIVAPRTVAELAEALRTSTGPVAIGGGRYSMGGQTATPQGLQLDLRELRGVVAIDTGAQTITVLAGTTWREVQEALDPLGFAVKVMQTYNTFTIGGSLSVNAHGRYIGHGPVSGTVRRLTMVIANGEVVSASPTERPTLFYGALGGYGGLGVIADATLELARNTRVRREDVAMPLAAYAAWFHDSVRNRAGVVFHNADIYPDAYDRVHAVTYVETDAPATLADRLHVREQGRAINRAAYQVMTEWPGGKWFREHLLDPWLYRGNPVTWRNYEASYDVSELEPATRERETYVLQEYFIPVDSIAVFTARMRRILREARVNAVNISIRHALPDSLTLLRWAPGETFAFVLYYKQDTDSAARRAVGAWTRALMQAALESGGRWYLPYQPHATRTMFRAAYPGAAAFFAEKRRVDPTGRFTNTLWDLYAPDAMGDAPTVTADRLPAFLPADVRLALDSVNGYDRPEESTLLTHPEWDLVYTSEAYAAWLRDGRRPSAFPYSASIGTFWRSYWGTWHAARQHYPVSAGTHLMLGVIGTSTAAELGIKAMYEGTVGRLAEWVSPDGGTPEDRYAAKVADEYARFIAIRPWYEFDFGRALHELWTTLPVRGDGQIRKWERRAALSAEYAIKAAYAIAIGAGTHATYAADEDMRHLLVAGWPPAPGDSALRHVLDSVAPGSVVGPRLDRGYTLLRTPRYGPTRDAVRALARHTEQLRVAEVNGNGRVALTGVSACDWMPPAGAITVVAYRVPTDRIRCRALLQVSTRELLSVVRQFERDGRFALDHVYDY